MIKRNWFAWFRCASGTRPSWCNQKSIWPAGTNIRMILYNSIYTPIKYSKHLLYCLKISENVLVRKTNSIYRFIIAVGFKRACFWVFAVAFIWLWFWGIKCSHFVFYYLVIYVALCLLSRQEWRIENAESYGHIIFDDHQCTSIVDILKESVFELNCVKFTFW